MDNLNESIQNEETLKCTKARRRFLNVWTAVGAILLTGVLIYLLQILAVPVGIVLWTMIIVFCLRTPVNRLEKLGVSRVWGTTIAYVLMIIVLGLAGFLIFSPAFGFGDQLAGLFSSMPRYVEELINWGNNLYTQYEYLFDNDVVRSWLTDAQNSLASWAANLAKISTDGVLSVGTIVVNSFVAVGFAFVIAFWILLDLPALGRECRRLVGERHADDMEMLHLTFTRVMGGYIKGTLLQCAIIGVASGLLFALLGIPNYMALGGISGLLNIIPIIGPWLGGALAAVVGIFVSPVAAIVALLGTIVIQQFVYTFISPKIMQSSVDIHPALMLVVLMAGSAIGGAMSGLMGSLIGMLAAIPLVAVCKSVFVYYFEKKTGRRLVATDGVFFKGTPKEDEGINPMEDATSPHPAAVASAEKTEQRRAEVLGKLFKHDLYAAQRADSQKQSLGADRKETHCEDSNEPQSEQQLNQDETKETEK